MTMISADRYAEALRSIPAPGTGCHPYLLRVANLGVIAGVNPNQIHSDILQSIPKGNRRVSYREVQDTVQKADRSHSGGTFQPTLRPQPVVRNGKTTFQKIISQSKIHEEVDLWESSPIQIMNDPDQDSRLLLKTLYQPDNLIFIGERHQPGILGATIRTTAEWIKHFQNDGTTAPHIIVNPLSGKPALTKSGDKETLRGDACVKNFRYCLVEFDDMSREDQIRFWSAVKLPVVALIDSGGKSIHGWVDVRKLSKIETQEQWESEIKVRLYERILKPLGVDGACSNPARLSRLPGHLRSEKKALQKLLWLSSEGRPVHDNGV